MLFPEQLCHFQYDGGLQNTRLTENGRPPEPNLCMVSLISKIKAYIHPNLFLTASKSLKARLVVFSSRHAILQFWSFRTVTREATLWHSCLTERRAPSEACIDGNIGGCHCRQSSTLNNNVTVAREMAERHFYRSFLSHFSG